MNVRAAVATEAGRPLEIMTAQLDGPRDGEVLVEIKATGICHTDEFTLLGADPEGLFPAFLGHESAGVVVDVGCKRTRPTWAALYSMSCSPARGQSVGCNPNRTPSSAE
ncbi:alcohol dehydrogenase catalytic domain-containing protein [Mesorhizobium sp. VK23E]|nr:alcohol dehydrogenase catalytic domain-containing protein [Mesorhizobium sp. VK23E]MDX8514627.1 alcohol dehydrogenase catalytic domain-containing protein [Mesorhizobium sp. VK23E]